jgi:AbiJ N-terminal domain 4
MDDALRNRLWNCLTVHFLQPSHSWLSSSQTLRSLCFSLWNDFFKIPIDSLPGRSAEAIKELRYRYFNSDWLEVYDLVEFTASATQGNTDQFQSDCNDVLASELSAYRFVGGKIIETTSGTEIETIEQALDATRPLRPVHAHFQAALDKLADRAAPDYRNSIKESVSAVEALCNLIVGSKATLGQAIRKLDDAGVEVHPALKGAFTKMYGYTSDADGIRHALMAESTLDSEDAMFMLVSCSGFVNYLLAKSAKGNLTL